MGLGLIQTQTPLCEQPGVPRPVILTVLPTTPHNLWPEGDKRLKHRQWQRADQDQVQQQSTGEHPPSSTARGLVQSANPGTHIKARNQESDHESYPPTILDEFRVTTTTTTIDAPSTQHDRTQGPSNHHQEAAHTRGCKHGPSPPPTLWFGTLESPNGQPSEDSAQKTHPNSDKQRQEQGPNRSHLHGDHPLKQQSREDQENPKRRNRQHRCHE